MGNAGTYMGLTRTNALIEVISPLREGPTRGLKLADLGSASGRVGSLKNIPNISSDLTYVECAGAMVARLVSHFVTSRILSQWAKEATVY